MKGFRNPSRQEDLGAVVSVIIDESSGNFVLVKDWQKPAPQYWKFPGGKIDREDVDPKHPGDVEHTACRAAKREGEEETGLTVTIDPDRLMVIRKERHDLHVFVGLADFSHLVATGDEGEEVRSFSLEEIQVLPDFFQNHRPILEMVVEKLRTLQSA